MASDYIDLNFENECDDQLHTTDDDTSSTEPPDNWQCKNCLTINSKYGEILYTVNNKNKCHICKFRKPKHFNWKNYTHYADKVVFGYCREIRDAKDFRFRNIPIYLIEMVKTFYIIKIQKNMAITTRPTEGIYIWNYSITLIQPKKNCRSKINEYVMMEIGLQESNVKVKNKFHLQSYLLNDFSRIKKKYCPQLKIGDNITMQLDYNDCSLSFGINNDWYGQFMEINGNLDYVTKLFIYSSKAQIQLKNLIIIPIKPSPMQRALFISKKHNINITIAMIEDAFNKETDENKHKMIGLLLACIGTE